MTHVEAIDKGLLENLPHNEIIRKVYLTYPTMALIGEEERQFIIVDEISRYFKIPINNVHVVGSAKTGQSFHKNTPFAPKYSDLDIAIIDSELFRRYSELAFMLSDGFRDQTVFPIRSNRPTFNSYTQYIAKGIFRPDMMPVGTERADWFNFFGRLSTKHKDLFSTINAGIYFSQIYFEQKQISIINDHISNKPI
ncbi:hypothetical protein [Pedobacter sp. L105]|uniref:hypothetical protein n=1 Tax=Pedobacter sp. L105 TaxID=1641871 RepID=UPI00131E4D9D|nr:hypothetical protein [Pedobacter sp. L105]